MSSKNNVNPDYYKQTGKNRPSDANPERGHAASERDRQTRDRWDEREKDKKKKKTA